MLRGVHEAKWTSRACASKPCLPRKRNCFGTEGHFALRGMNPGDFLVMAFEEMQQDYRSAEFVKKYESKGQRVGLEEGGKKSVVLKVITEED